MKKPLLYPKLAWQGIRKNAETYLPYLLMGILMVGVSYTEPLSAGRNGAD